MIYSDMQISPVRLNKAFSLLWLRSRLAAALDLNVHLLRSIHPFTRRHPHKPVWKSCATGNFSLNSSTNGLPPFFPFSADDFAFRSDFTRPIAAAASDIEIVFILHLLRDCGSLRLSHNLRGLVAQAVRAAVFFQFIRIGIHAPDSQLCNQSFKFVSLLKVHFNFPLYFGLLILIYILSFGLSSIIFTKLKIIYSPQYQQVIPFMRLNTKINHQAVK